MCHYHYHGEFCFNCDTVIKQTRGERLSTCETALRGEPCIEEDVGSVDTTSDDICEDCAKMIMIPPFIIDDTPIETTSETTTENTTDNTTDNNTTS